MKLRKIIWLLCTDAFYIHMNERNISTAEYIEASANGSFAELKKYFDHEVLEIIPDAGCVEIVLKEMQ